MARQPIFPLRLDPETKAAWEQGAVAAGLSLSEFIRCSVNAALGREDLRVASKVALPLPGKSSYAPDPKDKPRRPA